MNKKIAKTIACASAMTAVVAGSCLLFACNDSTTSEQKLAAPVISIDGSVVSWSAVEHATSYDVTVGANTVDTTDTSYTISVSETGEYKVSVIAKTTESGWSNSDKSNELVYKYVKPTGGDEDDKTLNSRLKLDAQPTKAVYFLDEKASAVDLTGIRVKAVYSDKSEKELTVADLKVKNVVDLTTVGQKKVEVEYEDTVGGGTAVCDFRIQVKQRTVADLDAAGTEYVAVENEFSATAEKYKISDKKLTAVTDMTGASLAVTTDDDGTYVAASAFAKSGAKLVNADGEFLNIIVASYIRTADDFKAINDNLDGYYILQNDLSLDGHWVKNNVMSEWWSKGVSPIGQAPIKGTGAENDPVTLVFGDATELTQEGKPFTGTFDGRGHIVNDLLIMYQDAPWSYKSHYLGMFGYIGETGTVKNFTLRDADVKGGQASALIAGVNLGTIENVVIDDGCKLFVEYAAERGCGYVADYNGGTVKNVACYASYFKYGSWDNQTFTDIGATLIAATKDGKGTAANCVNGDKTDLTDTFGDGWVYVENSGTYYGSETFGKAVSYDKKIYVGQDINIKVFSNAEIETIEFLADWTANEAAEELDAPVLEIKNNSGGDYVIRFADSVTSALFENVKMFKIGVKVNGVYVDSVAVTVGDPYALGISAVETQNITCIEGGELVLSGIKLTVEMTDGTTKSVSPTEVRGLDTSVVGEQDVVFVYNDGMNERTINGKVTVTASQGELTATLKAGVSKVIVPYAADGGWALDNVDWTQYLDVSAADYTVAVEGAIYGESITLTVSSGDLTPATVTADVWLGIADKAALRAIGNDLAGRYIITEEIAFDESRDAFTPISDVDNPFTGVLDGNYKKITNLDLYSESGWGFGMIVNNGGTIRNMVIASGKAYSGISASGIIAGVNRGGTIENCFVNVTELISDGAGAGGICYGNDAANSVVKGCVFIGKVQKSGGWAQGGIVGNNSEGGVMSDCLFVTISADGATTAIGDGAGTNVNTIASDKLAFNADDTAYYDTDNSAVTYTNGFTAEITALVKEYLRG